MNVIYERGTDVWRYHRSSTLCFISSHEQITDEICRRHIFVKVGALDFIDHATRITNYTSLIYFDKVTY